MPRSRAGLSIPVLPCADALGMPARYEYQLCYHQLTTAERVAKFHAELDRMAGGGWEVMACDTTSHPDTQVFWRRALPWPQAELEQEPQQDQQARVTELEAQCASLTAELARVTAERDSLRAALTAPVYSVP